MMDRRNPGLETALPNLFFAGAGPTEIVTKLAPTPVTPTPVTKLDPTPGCDTVIKVDLTAVLLGDEAGGHVGQYIPHYGQHGDGLAEILGVDLVERVGVGVVPVSVTLLNGSLR